MNTLYFVKFETRRPIAYDVIVFIFTADSPEDAEIKGRNMINPSIMPDYVLDKAEIICRTPDEVRCFEPV